MVWGTHKCNKLYDAEYSYIPCSPKDNLTFDELIQKIDDVVNDTWFRKNLEDCFSDTIQYNQNLSWSSEHGIFVWN